MMEKLGVGYLSYRAIAARAEDFFMRLIRRGLLLTLCFCFGSDQAKSKSPLTPLFQRGENPPFRFFRKVFSGFSDKFSFCKEPAG